MSRSLRPVVGVAAAVAALALSGCSSPVALTAADAAADPACAEVVVRLPDLIDQLEQRETNAQGTSAWGDPAGILLRCGLAPAAASTLPCVVVDDVFWLREEVSDDAATFTTFGRDPAVQVVVDRTQTSAGLVLSEVGDAVKFTPPTGAECRDVEDSLDDSSFEAPADEPATPSPSPSTER